MVARGLTRQDSHVDLSHSAPVLTDQELEEQE